MKTHHFKVGPFLVAAVLGASSHLIAGPVNVSGTPPAIDVEDISNMTWVGTSSDKAWSDTPNHGQSFTTGGSESGYLLRSFSMQAGNGSAAEQTPANKTWNIRLVAISGTSTSTIVLETGHVSSGTWNNGDWFAWTLNTPVTLSPNTLYGVDVEMTAGGAFQPGIPYFRYNTTSSVPNSYRYTRTDGDPSMITASASHDRLFHLDLSPASDTTPPTLVGRLPADDATDVPANLSITATFSENIQLGASGNITLDNLSGGGDVVINVASHGDQLSITGNVLTINPTMDLAPSSDYAVLISPGAIKDNFDPPNNFAGISDTTTWNFTTGVPDATPPAVVSLGPADNAAGVAINDNLVITFSENVLKGSGDIVITRTGIGVFETIPVGDARVSVSGAVVTINPSGIFAYGAGYHVELAAGVFKDLANLNFTGISGTNAWNFSTVAAPLVSTVATSSTAPPVVDLNKANLVAPTTGELMWSDRAMQGNTFTSDASGGILRSISVRISDGDGTVSAWKDYFIRVGTITLGSPNVFTAVRTETIRQATSAPSDSWFTFTLGAPITLLPNKLYGFQIGLAGTQSSDGIPVVRTTTADTFPGGQRFTGDVVNAGLGTAANLTTGDLVFHLDIRNPMLPSPNRMLLPVGNVLLTWTNMLPNTGSDVWVDVWFGTNPGSLSLVASKQLNLTSWTVNAPAANTYYWRIDSYLDGAPTGTPVQSSLFEFYVDDTDGDGFPDSYELLHTSPPSNVSLNRNDDRDSDLLTNWDEFQNGSNPSDPDTDNDGLLDGANITVTSADPRYAAWAADNILFTDAGPQRTFRGETTIGTNPLKPDTDGDGLPDGSESDIGTNPTLADTDADGLNDGVETNTGTYVSITNTGTNPLAADSDADGAGDWYEVAIIDARPGSPGYPPNSPNSSSLKPNIPYPLPAPDASTGATNKPVKVYIMSGQSNMVGFGQIAGAGPGTLQTMTGAENKFPNLVAPGGGWTSRKDVKYQGVISDIAKGDLKPDVAGDKYGPELGFGYVMGYHHDEPVLLIKASQGNRGLMWDFLPPGSPRTVAGATTYPSYGESPETWATVGGGPSPFEWYAGKQYDDCFLKESDMGSSTWAAAVTYPASCQVRLNGVAYISKAAHTSNAASQPGVGADWQLFWNLYSVFNTADILDNFATEYPSWAAQGFEIAGFVWWQGYDDTGEPRATRYEPNMVQFIKQVRSYYENRYPGKTVPNAPFVLATLAADGGWGNTSAGYVKVAQAQLNVDGSSGIYQEFANNVKTIEARGFWRDSTVSPNSQGYHYNWNAETYLLVGDALGRAMVDLNNVTPPATDYQNWAGLYPGKDLSDPNADLDGDGQTNNQERVWGLDPTSGASSNPISAPYNTATGALTYTRRNPALNTGVTYRYEWSVTLVAGSWQAFTPANVATSGASPVESVTITLPAGLLGDPKLFVRVVATSN